MTDKKLRSDDLPTEDGAADTSNEPSHGRRDAITKLAYVSPVIAGLLFSQRSVAQFSQGPPGLPR